jgi:hypothetical protein
MLLCIQCQTPDDGQRNCPKHVEFYYKDKFEKLVHLVVFIVRIRCTVLRMSNPSFPVFYSIIIIKADDTGIFEATPSLQPIAHHATNYVPDHDGYRGSFIVYKAPIHRRLRVSFLLQFNVTYFRDYPAV